MLDDGNLTMQRRLSKGDIDGGIGAMPTATALWACADSFATTGR
jgi:hypothetical protein